MPDFNLQVPESVDNAIKNLTDKGAKVGGNFIAAVFYLLTHNITKKATITALEDIAEVENKKVELFLQNLAEDIMFIPSANLKEPNLQIAGKAIDEALRCLDEPTLKEMFLKLITSTMDNSKSDYIHPSFADTISQMSSLDANIIETFKNNPVQPIVQYVINIEVNNESGSVININNAYINILGVNTKNYDSNSPMDYENQNIIKNSISISVLCKLGLIECSYMEYYIDRKIYDTYTHHSSYIEFVKSIPLPARAHLKHGLVRLTNYGKNFLEIVY